MYCKKCGTNNENDALFCKKCGTNLVEEYQKEMESSQKKAKSKSPKVKKKTKTKYKTKIKKIKPKNKKKNKREKRGIASTIMISLLILFVLILSAVCIALGYKLYTNENIEVPSLVHLSYEEASHLLNKKQLNIERIEKIVEDEEEIGIVLKQSKKSGKKVSKNTVIKVTVGVLDESIIVPNVVSLNLDEGKNILNHKNISYTIVYQEVEKEADNIILKQSPKKNAKIKKGDRVILTVSKVVEAQDINDLAEEDLESEDINDE